MNPTPAWLEKLIKLPDIDVNLKTFGGHKQRVLKGWKAEQETHFAFEIMLIIGGVQHTKFLGREVDFNKGDVVLIPPGTTHENSCLVDEGLEYFCMHFDLDDPEIQQYLLMYCPVLLDRKNPAFRSISIILHQYIDFLEKEQFNIREKISIEILLLELLVALLNYSDDEKVKIEHSENTDLLLAKNIAEIIQQNFRLYTQKPDEVNKDLLSMEKTAGKLNISNSTMLKVFKKVYTISPKQYLDQLRFNQAKFLLHQPTLSVAEIAYLIGYQNAAHFTRQFKNWANMTPKSYRKFQLENIK